MKLDKYLYIQAFLFSQGLADELSKDGACDEAIFPDTNMVITRCAIVGNQSAVGVNLFTYHVGNAHTHIHTVMIRVPQA